MSMFPLVDQYLGIRLDLDLSAVPAGEMVVVESVRRLRPEQSYGYVHALWGIWFEDGRVVVSVPPGARTEITRVLKDAQATHHRFDRAWLQRLKAPVEDALQQAGQPSVRSTWVGRMFACSNGLLRRHATGQCRRLVDDGVPPVEGLRLPVHCFPDGIVYGIVEAGCVVSVAYAHRTGIMEDRVVDIGVETAEAYRRRGFAKTVVSAVTAHVSRSGGEGLYGCGASHEASMATARSVGYELYGKGIILAADAPDAEGETG